MEKQTKTISKAPVKKVAPNAKPISVAKIVSNTITEVKAEMIEAKDEFKEVFTNAVEEISEQVDISFNVEQNLNKLKDLNAQLTKTAGEIFGEVKEMGQEIKEVTMKSMSEISKKADFNENVVLIKDSANEVKTILNKNVNKFKKKATKKVTSFVAEISENMEEMKSNSVKKADEFITEMAGNAIEMKETAVKLATEAVENIKINERIESAKSTLINVNNFALETTSNLIDNAEANGLKWQNIQKKAVNSGMNLVKNQEEIFFSTIETIKTQVTSSKNRFKSIFA